MPRIPAYVQPAGPIPGETAGAMPVLASTPFALGSQINALVGWQALRWFTRTHQVGSLLVDVPHPHATEGSADNAAWVYEDPPPIRWTRSPASRAVWVGIWYTAHDAVYGMVPEIGFPGYPPTLTVELQDAAGDTLDGPITWTLDNGFLEVSPNDRRALADAVAAADDDPVVGAANYYADTAPPDRFVQTGWALEPVDDEPRLLALPADGYGEVQLVVTSTALRVYGVIFAEAFFSEI